MVLSLPRQNLLISFEETKSSTLVQPPTILHPRGQWRGWCKLLRMLCRLQEEMHDHSSTTWTAFSSRTEPCCTPLQDSPLFPVLGSVSLHTVRSAEARCGGKSVEQAVKSSQSARPALEGENTGCGTECNGQRLLHPPWACLGSGRRTDCPWSSVLRHVDHIQAQGDLTADLELTRCPEVIFESPPIVTLPDVEDQDGPTSGPNVGPPGSCYPQRVRRAPDRFT